MKVSGTSILTRKILVCREFGTEAWRVFFRDIATIHPFFRRPITAQSFVPAPEFLAFHDELVRRFYAERPAALFELGTQSARWALIEGPLKDFVRDPEIESLVASFPRLWQRYFAETESCSSAVLTESGVEFRVRDLPAWHGYFEHFVIGYMKEMLELYCANPIRSQRLSESSTTSYCYLLATDPLPDHPTIGNGRESGVPAGKALRAAKVLTDRQLKVLRLVGIGKTNREIGLLLRISEKTVQHHIAHAYDRIGVYTRAGATLWLAERALLY